MGGNHFDKNGKFHKKLKFMISHDFEHAARIIVKKIR